MDFLVIMRMGDPKDPELQKRRAELRPAHLERASKFREAGHTLIGGATFDAQGNPTGSAAIARFNSREEVDAWLKEDPWTKGGVWTDFEVIPFRIAEHYPQAKT